jgi:hypothetical protein
MSKKIIIAVLCGFFSLAASLAISLMLNKPVPEAETAGEQITTMPADSQQIDINSVPHVQPAQIASMKEKKLSRLIIDVREKIDEYNNRLSKLEIREKRINTSHDLLVKDIKKLENMRIELANTAAKIKAEQDKLKMLQLEIAETEKSNLIALAATYDKMDATAAGKIFASMSKIQEQIYTENADEAVKILYYMTERTKAKVLAELVNNEPQLAALFSQRLKQVVKKD